MPVGINTFPTKPELERVSALSNFQKLYDLKHRPVLGLHEKIIKQYRKVEDLVYLAYAIPARISEFYGDFVQGDETRLVIAPPEDVDGLDDFFETLVYENDLIEKVYDIGVEQSEFGYCVLHVWKDEENIVHIDLTPQDQFFPQPDGSVVIATYKKDDNGGLMSGVVGFLLLTQEYRVEGTSVRITRKVWRTDERGVIQGEADKDRMAALLGKAIEDETTLEVDEIPFVLIPNGRKKGGTGKSDYIDIMPQLAEINERCTHVSTQLLKNLDAKQILPKVKELINEDGTIKPFEAMMLDGKEHITPQYLTNANPLIAETMEFVMFQLKMVSWITSVPMFELLKGSLPDRVESMRIQLFSAQRRTNTKRAKVVRGLKDAIRIAAKLSKQKLESDPVIKMSDVLPTDDLVEAQIEQTKVQSGLSSRRSAIMRINNIDEAEADVEMARIREEEQIAGVADFNTPPTV